jgi:hypothetical protein
MGSTPSKHQRVYFLYATSKVNEELENKIRNALPNNQISFISTEAYANIYPHSKCFLIYEATSRDPESLYDFEKDLQEKVAERKSKLLTVIVAQKKPTWEHKFQSNSRYFLFTTTNEFDAQIEKIALLVSKPEFSWRPYFTYACVGVSLLLGLHLFVSNDVLQKAITKIATEKADLEGKNKLMTKGLVVLQKAIVKIATEKADLAEKNKVLTKSLVETRILVIKIVREYMKQDKPPPTLKEVALTTMKSFGKRFIDILLSYNKYKPEM